MTSRERSPDIVSKNPHNSSITEFNGALFQLRLAIFNSVIFSIFSISLFASDTNISAGIFGSMRPDPPL